MKTKTIKGVIHKVYADEDEFRTEQPDSSIIENWRGAEEGDWVRVDDGQICQILRRGALKTTLGKDGGRRYVRTILGSKICMDKYLMEGDIPKNIYSFSTSNKSSYEIRRDRKDSTNSEFLFAKYVAKGEDVVDAFIHAYPTNNRNYAKQESGILLKTDRVRNLVREEIDKILYEAEITPLYLLEKMKEIVESSKAKDSDKVSVLKELVTIAGMKDTDKRSESVTLFQGFSSEQLDALSSPVKQLVNAERETEV